MRKVLLKERRIEKENIGLRCNDMGYPIRDDLKKKEKKDVT
jgi:hypothetical protein